MVKKEKILVLGIFMIFLCSTVSAGMRTEFFTSNPQVVAPEKLINSTKTISISIAICQKSEMKTLNIEVVPQDADKIFTLFNDLKTSITFHPFDDRTQQLKKDFITQLAAEKLLPASISPDQYSSLLNPPWFEKLRKEHKKISLPFQKTPNAEGGSASALFCSVSGEGIGVLFPFIMLPRPRIITGWSTLDGNTMVGKLLTIGGFIGHGSQFGFSLGFWGIGLAYGTPYGTFYGFIGYSLFTSVTAQSFDLYPPDYPPEIIGTDPADGAINVPESLAELSFSITDPSGDLMSYSVTTQPDIGSGTGSLKPAGTYTIPVHGLDGLTQYHWTVQVSDDVQTIEETFTFTTEAVAPVVSNPFPEDMAQDVPMDIPSLRFTLKDYQGDLMDYTVETSPEIGSQQQTGVPDGTYTVPVNGLMVGTSYHWFVNVTDGTHWTRKTFSFIAGYPASFDPFDLGWQYRKQVTIHHDLVDGDLSDFPVFISIVDPDLQAKAQDDGDDILFMDGIGDAFWLNHEIESYLSESGTLYAWVNVPFLSSSEDTVIYLYYGNGGCSSQQHVPDTWNDHFEAVWHLQNTPEEPISDSTQFHNDGLAEGAMSSSDVVDGKTGKCLDFDGINDLISFSEFTSALNTGSCTAWVQTTSSELGAVWAEGNEDDNKPYIILGKYTGDLLTYARDIYGMTSNFQGRLSVGVNDRQWHHIAWISEGSGNGNVFYFDGQEVSLIWQDGQYPNGIWFDDQSTDTHSIGGVDRPLQDWQWAGRLDEIRILNNPLTAAWITTEYANQNSPSSFVSVGPEEPHP